MKIKFLGAAGTVTGSCYLLTSTSGQSILIDCGIFQGSPELEKLNYDKLDCDCSKVEGLILTHAHLDHCGRLPTLLYQGFNKNIWMTPPTKDLAEISLLDSAKIGQEDRSKPMLFTMEETEAIFGLFKTVEYDKTFTVACFEIVMRDAGHIIGSASLEITDTSGTPGSNRIIFSGDLGNTPEDLINPTRLIETGDIVVMESTYGDKSHPPEDPEDIIQSEINAIEKTGGTLLIPAFSIERSQELLHIILHLKKSGKVKDETLVYFDSPMGERATLVFEKYPMYYNSELKKDMLSGSPFNFPGLIHIRHYQESKRLDSEQALGPEVIISGSGMMTGGRIVKHALHYLPMESTRLLIVGYQGENTLGRKILEGERDVYIQGTPITINANVSQTQAMSSHADQPRLMNWLKNIKGVKKVCLTHGENMQRGILSEKIKAELHISNVELPELNKEIEL